MPLINGGKYSCEPCIRGHRATSCAHSDRILIEVRKPGRPLESCGHDFATCNCGKLNGLLFMGDGLSNPASLIYTQHTKEKSGLTNPPKSGIPKRNTRAQSATRQSTRSKKKQKRSSSALPPTTEGQKKIHLGQDEPQNVASGSPQSQFNSFAGSTYQSTSGLPSSFLPYQVTQHIAAPHQRPSNPVHDQDLPELYLSRIKDATRVPSVPSQGNSIVHDQSYVRPHYVVARRDSLPEAKRQG